MCVCKADGDVSAHFLAATATEIARGTRAQFHAITATGIQQWAVETVGSEALLMSIAACHLTPK